MILQILFIKIAKTPAKATATLPHRLLVCHMVLASKNSLYLFQNPSELALGALE